MYGWATCLYYTKLSKIPTIPMQVIADLQLHSRFARAVSKHMTIPNIAGWAKRKGIGLVATGDWTHPVWFREIGENLEEVGNGLLRLKKGVEPTDVPLSKLPTPDPLFLLATEVSCIYSQGGKVRRVHTLLWVPTLSSAAKINRALTDRGCNLLSDGRPILGLTSIQLSELVFGIEPKALIIPAHSWTPWFALFGSMSGFDTLAEAFGPYTDRIYAIETGLSSDPSMNWRISELDTRAIVSFSDAHSGPKLGRETTVFELPTMSYDAIHQALSAPTKATRIAYTTEFYPEEGKYHLTGHRLCNVRQTPQETHDNGSICPVCGKPLTVGVMHRVDQLAARSEASVGVVELPPSSTLKAKMFGSTAYPDRPPFIMLVPLLEIIAEAIGSAVTSLKVQRLYFRLTDAIGSEFYILLEADITNVAKIVGHRIAESIERVRRGQLHIDPGYDGKFGIVTIWEDREGENTKNTKAQLSLLTE